MSSLQSLNQNAETLKQPAAQAMAVGAAKGLHEVMKTNLGPKGTVKMLVGGAGGKSVLVLNFFSPPRVSRQTYSFN